MVNKQLLISCIKDTVKLLELHGANPFQVQHYRRAALEIARVAPSQPSSKVDYHNAPLSRVTRRLLEEILQTGSLKRRDELLLRTPSGVLDMMALRTLGPKRAALLWKELNISNIAELEQACLSGKTAALVGFGQKIQAALLHSIDCRKKYLGRWRYNVADACASILEKGLQSQFPEAYISRAGALRRCLETVDRISWVVGCSDLEAVASWLQHTEDLEGALSTHDVPVAWRGVWKSYKLPVTVWLCPKNTFFAQLMLRTGSAAHLALPLLSPEDTLEKIIKRTPKASLESEHALYEAAGCAWVPPELRQGLIESRWMKKETTQRLIEEKDLQGILHVHTTYSDGHDGLQAMAERCRTLGYGYLGVTDHSQRAVYAGGMSLEMLGAQHLEIDRLNRVMTPFKIFKGAEVDILSDGKLDYPQDVLDGLDFVIASIHSDLNMGRSEATGRIIKAIEHPSTTLLGHASNRLLLKREGLPLDYKAVIEACAACQVIIELNANPYRLELDWRWIDYAISCGVMISINPDAHHLAAIEDVRYGVRMARKGGLTPERTFNALSVEQVTAYFRKKRMEQAV